MSLSRLMARRSCSFASTMRPDARVAGKVENDRGDLGMYRLRPEQNGFPLSQRGHISLFLYGKSLNSCQSVNGYPPTCNRCSHCRNSPSAPKSPRPVISQSFKARPSATLLTAYFGCQRSSVDFSSVYSYICAKPQIHPQQRRPERASVSLSRSLKVVAVTFGRAGSGNPDALLSSLFLFKFKRDDSAAF
jgi:hypothetical protein